MNGRSSAELQVAVDSDPQCRQNATIAWFTPTATPSTMQTTAPGQEAEHAFNYPGYYKMNRAQASQDQKHNVQVYASTSRPSATAEVAEQQQRSERDRGRLAVDRPIQLLRCLPFSVSPTATISMRRAARSTPSGCAISNYRKGTRAPSAARFPRQPWFNPPRLPTQPSRRLAQQIPPTPRRSSPTRIATSSAAWHGVVNGNLFKGFRRTVRANSRSAWKCSISSITRI